MDVEYLAEKLYKLATYTDGMTDAARYIAILTGSRGCALLVQEVTSPMPESGWFWGLNVDWVLSYRDHYYQYDNRFVEHFSHPPGVAYASEFNCENPEFANGVFYQEWCLPQDLAYFAGIHIMLDDKRALRLTMQRGIKHGQYEQSTLKDLEALMPHLKRSLAIHKRFVSLTTQAQVLEETLSAGRQALLLLNSDFEVQHCNAAAKIAMKGCIGIKGKTLKANDCESQTVLDGALKAGYSMLNTADGKPPQGGLHISLERSGKLPLAIFISPVRIAEATNYGPFQGEYLRMQLIDPGMCLVLEAKQLEQVLGLTAAEARVGAHLCCGSSAIEIGKALNISPHTVRDHSRNIYSRVGVKRQSEFVAKAYAVLNPNYLTQIPEQVN